MKRLVVFFSMVFLASLAFGQATKVQQEMSKTEAFSARSGRLMQKTFIDVARVKDTDVQVVVFTDLIDSTKMKGLRFSKIVVLSSLATDEKVAVLDEDEVNALEQSIMIMRDRVMNTQPNYYTEAIYRSRGGFEAGCFYSDGKWKAYLKLRKYDSKSYEFLDAGQFMRLLTVIKQAKRIMAMQ